MIALLSQIDVRFDLGTIDWTALSAAGTFILAVLIWWQVRLQRLELTQREALARKHRTVVRRFAQRLVRRAGEAIEPAVEIRAAIAPRVPVACSGQYHGAASRCRI